MSAHPYLDHPSVVALASQPGSDQQVQQQAQSVAQAISQTWDGYEQTWSDPVLQSKPSVQTGIVQYIHDTIGAPPIDAGTIQQLQASLQKDGLGAGLPTDGAWTADWQQQYNQALEALRANQLAGEKPGSVKTSSALHSFLGHLTVTGALDSIWGWAKSLPNDARVASGTVAGGLAGLGHVVTHPSEILGNSEAEKQTIASVNSAVQNALGGHTSKQKQINTETLAGQLSALNAALSVSLVTGIVKKAAVDIGANIAKGSLEKGAPELTRKPGVIAKTLFNGSGNGRLLGSKWVGNLPGLARVTPLVGKLAGEDGFYYRARTFLAQPYRYAPVRAAGQAFSRSQVLGLGLYGQALATSKLPGNTEAQSVLDTHTFSAIDHNIANYGPRLFGWSPMDVNNLALFLHGPIGMGTKGSASQSVGEHVQNFTNTFTDLLGEKGVMAAFEQATNLTHNQLMQAAEGDSQFLSAFMTSKVLGYAKDWWADHQLGEPLHGSAKDQIARLTQLKRDFNALPLDQKAQAVSDMIASDPSMTYLTTRISGDIARGAIDPKAAMRGSLATFKQQYERMQEGHANGYLQYFMSPKGRALLNEERMFHNEANLPPDFGSARHMAELNPNLEQDLGLARMDTLTRNQVLDQGGLADQFEKALTDAGDDPAARLKVAQDMAKHLFENHNWDERKLGLFGDTDNPEALLKAARSEAEDLASDVIPTFDITAQAQRWMKDLNDAGYKLVVGDHLGDFYTGNMPDIGATNGRLTRLRKWAGKTGIDPAKVPDQEVGRATRQGIISALTPVFVKLREQGLLNAYQTPQTFMAMLRENGGVQKSLTRPEAAIFHGAAKVGLNKTEVEHLFKQGSADSLEAARGELEQRIASGIGPRDLTRKAIINALLSTHTIKTDNGGEWTWHGLPGGNITDEALKTATPEVKAAYKQAKGAANQIYRAVLDGYRQPGYIMGWQAIENWARAGFGFGNQIAKRYPGNDLIQAVANWPNRVVQVRNRLRFTVSFQFDIRRWVKQSAKMVAEGVTPVANPLQRLIDDGSDQQAKNLLAKIGGRFNEVNDQMDADRMLAGRSLYGIYSPQWHAAYFINEKRKQLLANAPKEPFELPISRRHVPGEDLDTPRPWGTSYSLNDEADNSDRAMRDTQTALTTRYGTTRNSLVLSARSGADAPYNPGEAAIEHFLGPSEWQRIDGLSTSDLAAEVGRRWPKLPSSDNREKLLDMYGAQLAREHGYKAIVFRKSGGFYSEYLDLGGHTSTVPSRAADVEKEVKDAYNRVFKYGAQGGTSPLERSVNTVFFPFSFEKTLIRNFGGYLLDRPAQALMLDAAVEEWRKADKNATIGRFVEDHFPILWEMNALNNAFTHGISPGQFGGINAPLLGGAAGVARNAYHAATTPSNPSDGQKSLVLLNLFLPQHWGANLTTKNLQRYLPVWGQFSKIWQAAQEQTQIGTNALYDTVAHTTNRIRIRPTLTSFAQQQYGLREKVHIADQLQAVLDYNGRQGSDADKILWPVSDQVPSPIWGQPISKTTIGEYVHAMYPAYNPDESSAYAVQQERAEAQFISQVSVKDPAKAQAMASFAKIANSVIGKINRDEYTPQQLAQVQGLLHEYGRSTSGLDSDWKRLYTEFFSYALGPIVSPSGKAAA